MNIFNKLFSKETLIAKDCLEKEEKNYYSAGIFISITKIEKTNEQSGIYI